MNPKLISSDPGEIPPEDEPSTTLMVCVYCGTPCELWCRPCGENHLVTEAEFVAYHAD